MHVLHAQHLHAEPIKSQLSHKRQDKRRAEGSPRNLLDADAGKGRLTSILTWVLLLNLFNWMGPLVFRADLVIGLSRADYKRLGRDLLRWCRPVPLG